MSPFLVPDEITKEIDYALVNLDSPLKLRESKLLSLSIVVKREQENPGELPYQSLKAILTEILEVLAKENPNYAEILRGRFWEGLSPPEMISKERPKRWAEKTFYNYQKKARQEFYSILWQREQNLKQENLLQSSVDMESREVEAHEAISHKKIKFPERPLFNSPWAYIFLVLFIIVGAAFLFRTPPKGEQLPQSTLEPNSTPIPLSPTAPDITPTSINKISFCGEAEQIPVDLGIPRFIRSQGISNFNVENTPGILNNTIRKLAIDHTGLWIGYFGNQKNEANGVGYYDKKVFANCNFLKFIQGENINSIAVSQFGKTWIGTEKNGVLSFDGQDWKLYTTHDGLPSDEIFGMTIDEDDNLWVGTWEGVAKFDGTSWSVPYQAQNETIFNNHIAAIAFDSEKNIWIGHIGDGVSEYHQRDGKWIYYTTKNGLAGNEIRDIIIRPKNAEQPESIWFGTADGGISRLEQGKWTNYQVEDGLPSNNVNDLALDRYNRIWAATAKGVAYFDDRIWKIYDTLDTTTLAIGASCQDKQCPFDDDHVWTGTPSMGLTHSRLPLPDTVINVIKICFVTAQRERICPNISYDSLDTSSPEPAVTATFPTPLIPGDTLRFEITVSPLKKYELRENRGDFMSNTDDNDFNLFGAWPVIGVKGIVVPGQPYTFTDYDNPFVAPTLTSEKKEEQFVSTWRMWMYTRYVGPYIRLIFTVKNN